MRSDAGATRVRWTIEERAALVREVAKLVHTRSMSPLRALERAQTSVLQLHRRRTVAALAQVPWLAPALKEYAKQMRAQSKSQPSVSSPASEKLPQYELRPVLPGLNPADAYGGPVPVVAPPETPPPPASAPPETPSALDSLVQDLLSRPRIRAALIELIREAIASEGPQARLGAPSDDTVIAAGGPESERTPSADESVSPPTLEVPSERKLLLLGLPRDQVENFTREFNQPGKMSVQIWSPGDPVERIAALATTVDTVAALTRFLVADEAKIASNANPRVVPHPGSVATIRAWLIQQSLPPARRT